MEQVEITIGAERFRARFRSEAAPETCRRFRAMLPWCRQLVHARWSGEACWIPLGEFELGVGLENPVHTPAPGELIFYPGGVSEAEVLIPYGVTRFRCEAGNLTGSPLLKIEEGLDRLASVGTHVLHAGATGVTFTLVSM
jgi:hypothetical protein